MTEQSQHPLEHLSPSRTKRLLKALSSYYAIALGIAMASALLFGWLADEVMEREFVDVNTSILLSIHSHRTPTLDTLAFATTNMGGPIGIAIIGAILVSALIMMKRHVDLATLAAVLIGATVIVFTFKVFFHQVRPHVFEPMVPEKDYSFPSGHSLTSFSLWGFFAWWIISLRPKDLWRWILASMGILMAVLVACSRMYLGVHWPTDVTAGMLLGFSWVSVCVTGQRWLTRHARRERKRQQSLEEAVAIAESVKKAGSEIVEQPVDTPRTEPVPNP